MMDPAAIERLLPPEEHTDVIALAKGSERYIILYDRTTRAAAMRQLGAWASNHELSFSWYDAANLSMKMRQVARGDNQ